MKTFLLLAFTLLFSTSHAQFGKDLLNKVKETSKQKINNKIDQKTSEGVDKVINAPETAVKKKKQKKGNTTIDETTVASSQETNATTTTDVVTEENTMAGEGAQTVIQTNVVCENGKKKIEAILKKQDGVFEVKVNIKNGEIAIRYSSDGTSYTTLLQLINEQGFEADGNKPAAGAPSNPCKTGKK